MENKESTVIQVYPNKFNNIDSEFAPQIPLNTNAKQVSPHYAMFSLTSDDEKKKIAAIKTFQGITVVEFKNTEFVRFEKLSLEELGVDQTNLTYLTFKREVFSLTSPASLILGYRHGLIAHVGCNNKVLGLYNYDEKNKSKYSHKSEAVSLITTIPDSNGDEILVLFADSSVIKYQMASKSTNNLFVEKLKRFEQKISFKDHLNKFRHHQKTKNNICYGSELKDSTPEFNFFYAYNDSFPVTNPTAYYKFNHRTITDIVVKKHTSFTRTIFRDIKQKEVTVLAFVSLDGYLTIYGYPKMVPRLSYKTTFGGINSVVFSENCELVALGGQDDCITVLDLYTLKTLRCEGHTSFVSRAIFQTIPFKGASNEFVQTRISRDNSREKEESSESRYVRIISSGLDSNLGFWEFDKYLLRQDKPSFMEERNLPIRLTQNNMVGSMTMQPTKMAQVKDAIAWVEVSENMLFYADYDGTVGIYNIKNLNEASIPSLSPIKQRKPSESSTEMRTSYSKASNTAQRENSYANSRDEHVRESGNYSRGSREDVNGKETYSSNQGRSALPHSSLSTLMKEKEDKNILSRKKNGY